MADILNQVRALLTKAEATEFPAEAEALTAKAAELMARYGIDKALATAFGDRRELPVDKVVDIENPYANRKAALYYGILRVFGGDAVLTSAGTSTRLRVYGFEADLMAVDILYTSLLLQAAHQSHHVPEGPSARGYRTAFWAGFTNTVLARLREAYEAAKVESKPGTDLVLRDRALEVSALMRKNHPHVRTTTTRGRVNIKGYEAGQAAGRRANIHDKTEVRGRGRRALA